MEIRDFETMYLAEIGEARRFEEIQLDALPSMADAADDRELAEAFRAHYAHARTQFDRLSDILRRNRIAGSSVRDESMLELVAEIGRVTATFERGPMRDAAMIAAAQRIEHYEIALYGTLATYAKMLGRHEEKRILGAMLEEERANDEDLSDIAEGIVNPHALGVAA